MSFWKVLVAAIGITGLAIPSAQAEVKISGLLEAEAVSTEDFAGVKSSDIVLATIELNVDTKVNDSVTVHLKALYEDDGIEELEIDEGVITYAYSGSSYVSAGRMYVPFGVFETNMISDPLTLELAETREAALRFGYVGNVYGSIYFFNGDTQEAANVEDKIEHYGVNLGLNRNLGGETVNLGVGYISSLGNSDSMTEVIDTNTLGAGVSQYVSATSLHYYYRSGAFSFYVEYIKADNAFTTGEFDFNGAGAQPEVTNIEIGQSTGNAIWALALQETEQAFALGLPESRQMLSYTTQLGKDTRFSIEYIKDKDYSIGGGSGASAETITLQLAAEFK